MNLINHRATDELGRWLKDCVFDVTPTAEQSADFDAGAYTPQPTNVPWVQTISDYQLDWLLKDAVKSRGQDLQNILRTRRSGRDVKWPQSHLLETRRFIVSFRKERDRRAYLSQFLQAAE